MVRPTVRLLAAQASLFLLPALIPGHQPSDRGDPPARVARLSAVQGSVSFLPAGATDWNQAVQNYTVTTGDRIYPDRGARAELEVGPFAMRLDEGTDLTFSNLSDDYTQLVLQQGTMRLSVYRLEPGDSIEVDTPSGALSVLSPGEYRVDVSPMNGRTLVSVDRGRMEISGPGLDQVVERGAAVQLIGSNPIRLTSMTRPGATDFDRWCADRDRRFASTTSSQYVSNDIPGYEELDASGRWEQDASYGPVWYPTTVVVDWVPYRYGRWLWVEPWGWTWIADEPWGFAPFHYGRWVRGRSRWGWVPGPIVRRPYYAPALVAFVDVRSGPGGGVQAWFPLGPREPYFPSYHHGDGYLRRVNSTNLRNVVDINVLININNVQNIRYENRATAVTAVPAATFSGARPVAREAVHIDQQSIARAPIMPHPTAAPEAHAVAGGAPVPRPPVAPRPVVVTHNPPGASVRERPVIPQPVPVPHPTNPAVMTSPPPARGSAGTPPPVATPPAVTPPHVTTPPVVVPPTSAPPPVVTKRPAPDHPRNAATPPVAVPTPPPAGSPTTSPPSPPPPHPANPASAPAGAPAPATPSAPPARPVIAKRAPLPEPVALPQKQEAMQQHPGRPLEPQQIDHLRAGKAAGPPKDPEQPPHPGKAPEDTTKKAAKRP